MKLNLFKKITLPTIAGLVILGAAAMFVSTQAVKHLGDQAVANLRDTMLAEKTEKIRNLVETAHHVVENAYKRENLSEEERQQLALSAVKAMRYNKADYFWINDTNAVIVMHPIKPALDGKDMSGFKDAAGKKIFVEFANVGKSAGQGTVEYMWPKPGRRNRWRNSLLSNCSAPGAGSSARASTSMMWRLLWRKPPPESRRPRPASETR
jgi:methyl-accepting chemotaxis protein